MCVFFFSSRRRHTRWPRDWSSDVCSSDLPDMIRMHVSQNYFPDASTFGNQRINTCSKSLLLIFVRRTRIDDEQLCGVVDEITVSVRSWRPGRSAHGKADVVWPKLNTAHRLTEGVWRCKKSFIKIVSQSVCQCFQSMQNWRHGEYFGALPARQCRACSDPFATGEFRVTAHVSVLFPRTVNEKEPGIETPRAEWRSYPAAHESDIAGVKMKIVMLE